MSYSSYTPARYDHINFVPPDAVAANGSKGLKLRQQHNSDASTPVGIARARDLHNQVSLSPDTIHRMVSYFARHEVDKKATNFGNDDHPSNGYISWLLRGGDEGKQRAEDIQNQMKQADEHDASE